MVFSARSPDFGEALKFYTEVLGFRLLTDQPFNDQQRWIELGVPGADTRLVLFQFGESPKAGGILNASFWADDVEATANELKAEGVQFVMEPKKQHYGTICIFKNAEDNSIMIGTK